MGDAVRKLYGGGWIGLRGERAYRAIEVSIYGRKRHTMEVHKTIPRGTEAPALKGRDFSSDGLTHAKWLHLISRPSFACPAVLGSLSAPRLRGIREESRDAED